MTLLETNPKFVESFLVGLNAEMSRELLWRNYPDRSARHILPPVLGTSVGSDRPDIDGSTSGATHQLGQNADARVSSLVLLIRGELLRRYPNSVIYAVAAVSQDGTARRCRRIRRRNATRSFAAR